MCVKRNLNTVQAPTYRRLRHWWYVTCDKPLSCELSAQTFNVVTEACREAANFTPG